MTATTGIERAVHTLIEKRALAPRVTLYRILAPAVADARKPGQFVIVRVAEGGERIPLTIADADPKNGTITLVVQEVGTSTAKMARLPVGTAVADVVGPLGSPTHIERVGLVACVGGGIGIAPVHPIAQGMHAAGNQVISLLCARNRDLLFFREEMRRASDEVRIYTDDGSEGKKGLATDAINDLVKEGRRPNLVVAIGPVPMMKFLSRLTKELGIPTVVSLNPVMVDGTGMCGGCRVTVGGKTKFVCVDGPEFDGHQVDFDELVRRQAVYREEEKLSYERFTKEHP
ncbi:MAG: sulfide/dihydroorotate dehydrogenase-like FAD/NAD-binding protein [Planctomycetes bacterium]|nr:sulfide/dihydroorotate dehydrogenase-like FAD/NAD-binding protein [Planctomycetota bacterium]